MFIVLGTLHGFVFVVVVVGCASCCCWSTCAICFCINVDADVAGWTWKASVQQALIRKTNQNDPRNNMDDPNIMIEFVDFALLCFALEKSEISGSRSSVYTVSPRIEIPSSRMLLPLLLLFLLLCRDDHANERLTGHGLWCQEASALLFKKYELQPRDLTDLQPNNRARKQSGSNRWIIHTWRKYKDFFASSLCWKWRVERWSQTTGEYDKR